MNIIVVVGTANRSNSSRFRETGTEAGVARYLIAGGSELDPERPRDAGTVVTSGASAPDVLVEDVIEALRRIGLLTGSPLPGWRTWNSVCPSNLRRAERRIVSNCQVEKENLQWQYRS